MREAPLRLFPAPPPCGLLLFFALALPLLLPAQEGGSEKGSRDALEARLREKNIPFEERPLLGEYGGFNSSVHVLIPPAEAPDPGAAEAPFSFMLAIPLSSGDGTALSFNAETGVAFIEKILERGAPVEIRAAFLGDERSRLPREFQGDLHAGLEDLCSIPDIPENTALLYLDLAGPPGKLVVHHGSARSVAPLSLIEPLTSLAKRRGIPWGLAVHFNEIYKLALADGPSALAVTRDWGINAVYVTGEGGAVSADAVAELLADYAAAFKASPENPDTHYSVFVEIPGKSLFLSEQILVFLMLLGSGVFIACLGLYSLFRRKTIIMRRKIFFRYSWLILLLFVLLAGTLRGAALFFSLLFRFFGGSFVPGYGAAALAFLFAMLLFSLFAPFLDRIRIPWKEIFYGSAALLLVCAGTLVAAALDISFLPVFLWAFLFIVAGMLIKLPPLIYLSALISPVMAFLALGNLVAEGNRKLAASFLGGNFKVTLYIALVCLPFVLVIKRGALLLRKRRPRQRTAKALLPRLALAALNGLVLVLFVRQSAAAVPPPPQRRVLGETEAPRPLKLGMTDRIFLESRIAEIRLEAPGDPVRFDLYLESDDPEYPPLIYSAPAPLEAAGENTLRLVLGEGPPNPLVTELALPPDFSGRLRAEALYTAWNGEIDPGPLAESGGYLLRLTASLAVSSAVPRVQ